MKSMLRVSETINYSSTEVRGPLKAKKKNTMCKVAQGGWPRSARKAHWSLLISGWTDNTTPVTSSLITAQVWRVHLERMCPFTHKHCCIRRHVSAAMCFRKWAPNISTEHTQLTKLTSCNRPPRVSERSLEFLAPGPPVSEIKALNGGWHIL